MSKTKAKTPNYPCGDCGIGVKYSGIKCTGSCNFWFHGGCVNITNKELKKLTEVETSSWKCKNCSIFILPLTSNLSSSPCLSIQQTNATSATKSDVLNNSIKELERSLIESNSLEDPSNEEHKLQMAAKIGSALLEENKTLKEEKFKLETRLTIVEGKLEETENNEVKYIEKVEILLRKNAELQEQLDKEKQFRRETQDIFEEYDRQKEKALREQENTIMLLKVKIKSLEENKENNITQSQNTELIRTMIDSETQTHNPDILPQNSNSFLLAELTYLKLKQREMEQSILNLQTQITSKQQPEAHSTKNDSPTSSGQPNKTLSRSTPSKNHFSLRRTQNKKNIFSVSLQAAKHKEYLETPVDVNRNFKNTPQSAPLTHNNRDTDPKTHSNKLSIKPPGTKITPNSDEFYADLIENEIKRQSLETHKETRKAMPSQVKKSNKTNSDIEEANRNCPETSKGNSNRHFLEIRQQEEAKAKETITTRIFLNRKFWQKE